MVAAHNGLFAVGFECPTLARAGVQAFFVVQCLWTGSMGLLCTYDPAWSPITENGLFTRGKEKFAHPNVRGGWNVRGGSMFLREAYDCVELCLCKRGGARIAFGVWTSPFGPQPPLVVFLVMNILALRAVAGA
ncbi:hypothetical protein AURANDRAFT_68665 [Aureococcus anophagefferens]|uniref:Uncharacterized protein n=1 Tax=Aureococcus anophagefferens TaxID=44056 RepID=F0YQD2_AURAN|nr:hypothetical protein AURANDRAFT_68665 [Aureococcus anophagefferens]EGB02678.1 hypothetical protein AURANDRAFT_68665 [Aureococcus anophagefferens]|eukprot:XP_009042624.1 hypothetical protein AURANDRAFT_68665 [Aureococcus anophagefferens]